MGVDMHRLLAQQGEQISLRLSRSQMAIPPLRSMAHNNHLTFSVVSTTLSIPFASSLTTFGAILPADRAWAVSLNKLLLLSGLPGRDRIRTVYKEAVTVTQIYLAVHEGSTRRSRRGEAGCVGGADVHAQHAAQRSARVFEAPAPAPAHTRRSLALSRLQTGVRRS